MFRGCLTICTLRLYDHPPCAASRFSTSHNTSELDHRLGYLPNKQQNERRTAVTVGGWVPFQGPLFEVARGSLARVTPHSFAVLSFCAVLIVAKRKSALGTVSYAPRENKSPKLFSPLRHRITRASGSNPTMKEGGSPPTAILVGVWRHSATMSPVDAHHHITKNFAARRHRPPRRRRRRRSRHRYSK